MDIIETILKFITENPVEKVITAFVIFLLYKLSIIGLDLLTSNVLGTIDKSYRNEKITRIKRCLVSLVKETLTKVVVDCTECIRAYVVVERDRKIRVLYHSLSEIYSLSSLDGADISILAEILEGEQLPSFFERFGTIDIRVVPLTLNRHYYIVVEFANTCKDCSLTIIEKYTEVLAALIKLYETYRSITGEEDDEDLN